MADPQPTRMKNGKVRVRFVCAGLETVWGLRLRVIRNFSNAKVRFEIVGQMKGFLAPALQ